MKSMDAQEPEGNRRLEYIKGKYLGKQIQSSPSPAGNWLEFTLDAMKQGRGAIATVRKEMTNPYGNIHGGMMSARDG